ncbi:MAG: GreA/GreB family elongation factor [Candidatus Saccharibacteria bacterium]|nr:GreA/GreB family elongation factor [Candidatus Saccharibacteria bacterium]
MNNLTEIGKLLLYSGGATKIHWMGVQEMNYENSKFFPKNKHFHLTKKGLDGLRAQLDNLRKEQIKMSRRLINMDVKEKEEYIMSTDATSHLDNIELKVSEISDILQRADIITNSKSHSSVELGSTVFLESDFEKVRYTLVNSVEADPSANKISEESPLGRALIGKTIHSIISVVTPRGKKYSYRVLAVK